MNISVEKFRNQPVTRTYCSGQEIGYKKGYISNSSLKHCVL